MNSRILFLMPNWPTPSELWMHRMMDACGSSLAAIATYLAPTTASRGRVPVVSLLPHACYVASRFRVLPLVAGWGSGRLGNVLDRWDISAVLCQYLPCALSFRAVWKRSEVPLFVHCHGYDVTWGLRHASWPHPRVFNRRYPLAVRDLSERAILIANSHDTRRRIEAVGVSPERVRVKYCGVPVPARCPERHEKSDAVHILFLGRLVDFKGPELTIRAFDRACSRGLNGILTVAGDGPLRGVCTRAERGSVRRSRSLDGSGRTG